jgi:hypothetical protein
VPRQFPSLCSDSRRVLGGEKDDAKTDVVVTIVAIVPVAIGRSAPTC